MQFLENTVTNPLKSKKVVWFRRMLITKVTLFQLLVLSLQEQYIIIQTVYRKCIVRWPVKFTVVNMALEYIILD